MKRAIGLFAAVAMVPALFGPTLARAATLDLALCGGGAISIPLRDAPPPATQPCCAKGCHSGRKRTPLDRAQ